MTRFSLSARVAACPFEIHQDESTVKSSDNVRPDVMLSAFGIVYEGIVARTVGAAGFGIHSLTISLVMIANPMYKFFRM
jgi:hypothetical protein